MSDRLQEEARRLAFFQAVRLLRKLAPERSGVGRDADPDDEVVRFRSQVSTAFPTSDVARIEPPEEAGRPPRLTVAFLGVATPACFGSLPAPYVQAIFDQEREKSSVLRDFFDVFNHRLISLYYRAFEKYHLGLAWEAKEGDFFEQALRGILGLATKGLEERLRLADRSLFRRAGLLSMAPVPAAVVESLVESAFGVAAAVEQFVGTWYPLALEDQTRLGGVNAQLGVDACVGQAVRLLQYRFRIRVGPLSFDQYEAMLPTGTEFEPLFDLVRLAVASEQSFEIRLVLAAGEVPLLQLGGGPVRRPRLGWSSWLCDPARARDPEDARFASEAYATRRAAPRESAADPSTKREAA